MEKNQTEAVSWYRQAADQGYAAAQYNLGLCYAKGWGVEKNQTEAVSWYYKAAAQGRTDAQNALDEIWDGAKIGVDPKELTASNWEAKAKEKNDAGAQCNLGEMLSVRQGRGSGFEERVWFAPNAEWIKGITVHVCQVLPVRLGDGAE